MPDREPEPDCRNTEAFPYLLFVYCHGTFTQSHGLLRHQHHACVGGVKEPLPKEECPGCHQMLSQSIVFAHKKYGSVAPKEECPGCHGMLARSTVYTHKRFGCPTPKPIGERKECNGCHLPLSPKEHERDGCPTHQRKKTVVFRKECCTRFFH